MVIKPQKQEPVRESHLMVMEMEQPAERVMEQMLVMVTVMKKEI